MTTIITVPSKLFTPAETATLLGISVKTLRQHVKLGRIRFIPVGSGKQRQKRMFTARNIATFIEKQKVRESASWASPSTPIPHTGKSSFNSTVVPFEALPKPPTRKKQKP